MAVFKYLVKLMLGLIWFVFAIYILVIGIFGAATIVEYGIHCLIERGDLSLDGDAIVNWSLLLGLFLGCPPFFLFIKDHKPYGYRKTLRE